MTDEQIIEMADSMSWDTHEGISDENLITFARLIAQRQREIDAEICEAEEPWGNDADAWASTCLRRAAKAIRSQT
jgi:hypothetical protein